MNDIGEVLASTRESSGVSLEEASKDLDIKVEMLENIEDGRVGAFKDIYELKDYIQAYAKYLGLDDVSLIDEFNEYMFEYTSKIPVKEIEKEIAVMNKEEKKEEVIVSPYTKNKKKFSGWVYIVLYIVIFTLVIGAILWSIKQITVNRNTTDIISYYGK